MATVRIVPKKDMEVITRYIGEDHAVVLVTEDAAEQIKELHPDLKLEDGMDSSYDFGGDADYWVEVVAHDGHSFVSDLCDEQGIAVDDD